MLQLGGDGERILCFKFSSEGGYRSGSGMSQEATAEIQAGDSSSRDQGGS